MPIGDLLNQISGQESTAGPRPPSVPKRKPSTDLRGHDAKIPRRPSPPSKPAQPVSASSNRPLNPLASSVKSEARPTSSVLGSTSITPKPTVSRPLAKQPLPRPASTPTPSAAKAPPKKGSYAEVLARAQRAQAVMGQVGKLQHKSIEKGALKAKREEKMAPQAKGRSRPSQSTPAYKGTSRMSSNVSNSIDDASRDAGSRVNGIKRRNDGPTAGSNPRGASDSGACKTKYKKAAEATTGYTGTARPKTGESKKNGPRGGALLKTPSAAKRTKNSYLDEEDGDMDDFIDDDDEIDAEELSYREKQYRYVDSADDDSDMEVGLGELAVEESRAERIARREDIEEERLERSLKIAKEEKKRKALEALRAGKRR